MYLKLGGNICNWDACVSNPHEGRFLLDTSISSPPSPAPQTSQLLTSPSNTVQKPSHPRLPARTSQYKMLFLVGHTRQCAPSSLTLVPFRGSLEVDNDTVVMTISPIQLNDEGQYRSSQVLKQHRVFLLSRCEITYLDVSLGCPLVHATNVRTIGETGIVLLNVTCDQAARTI